MRYFSSGSEKIPHILLKYLFFSTQNLLYDESLYNFYTKNQNLNRIFMSVPI